MLTVFLLFFLTAAVQAIGEWIRVEAIDADTRQPVRGVKLFLQNETISLKRITDVNGQARFDRIAAGTYLIRSSFPSYGSYFRLLSVKSRGRRHMIIRLKNIESRQSKASVQGSIRSNLGELLPDIRIVFIEGHQEVPVDNLGGRFYVDLNPGRYHFLFKYPGIGVIRREVMVTKGQIGRLNIIIDLPFTKKRK